jgi:hypothetical protein
MTGIPTKLTMNQWMSNAPAIFSVATAALNRIEAPPRSGGHLDALVSIVFASASLEVFLREAEFLANKARSAPDEPTVVSTFASVMEDLEKSRGPIQARFQLASLVLTGRTYDKSAQPYQDFSLLIEARNELVHFKGDEYFLWERGEGIAGSTARVVKKLRSLNMLHEGTPGSIYLTKGTPILFFGNVSTRDAADDPLPKKQPDARASFTYLLGTRAAAEWACSAAAQMAMDFFSKIPPSCWKDHIKNFLLPAFSVPLLK